MNNEARLRLENALLRVWTEHGRSMRAGEPVAVPVGDGVNLVLTLMGSTADRESFTPCELDILTVLEKNRKRRLTAKEIQKSFIKAEIFWGGSTVHNALASLVARGVLINPRDKRGYGLAGPEENAV